MNTNLRKLKGELKKANLTKAWAARRLRISEGYLGRLMEEEGLFPSREINESIIWLTEVLEIFNERLK